MTSYERHSSCAFSSVSEDIIEVADLASVAQALVVVMAIRTRSVLGLAHPVRVVGVSLLAHEGFAALDVTLTLLRLLYTLDALAGLA